MSEGRDRSDREASGDQTARVSARSDCWCGWTSWDNKPCPVHAKVLLRVSDIAPMLGVTTGRVYQLIEAGVIPVTRIGRSIRIPRDVWEDWLKQKRGKDAPGSGGGIDRVRRVVPSDRTNRREDVP